MDDLADLLRLAVQRQSTDHCQRILNHMGLNLRQQRLQLQLQLLLLLPLHALLQLLQIGGHAQE
ncbi:hypothetical protein D3C81_2084310 [compost metagenome]